MNKIMLDPPVYETIKLLKNSIATKDDFEKLKRKSVEDIEYVIKKLQEGDFLIVFQDSRDNIYYSLKSDFEIKKCFPKFLINEIRQDFNDNVKNKKVLTQHLQILK